MIVPPRILIARACVALGALAVTPAIVRAQQRLTVADLEGRLSPSLRTAVAAVVDSASDAGLPAGPLVDKALEGAGKRASDERILAAVRGMARDLGAARHALGASSSADELTAAVAALRAGASRAELTKLRDALHGRSLTVPLSVLGTLMVQGVSSTLATAAVLNRAPLDSDARLLAFGNDVARAVAGGVPPATALGASLTNGSWNTTGVSATSGGRPPASQPASPRKP